MTLVYRPKLPLDFFADFTYFNEFLDYHYDTAISESYPVGEENDWIGVSVGFSYSGRF